MGLGFSGANTGCLDLTDGSGQAGTPGNERTGNGSGKGGTPMDETADREPLEVLHGWTGQERRDAMKSLTGAFERAYSETPIDVRPVADADVASLAERRIENGHPPGVFLVQFGESLQRFTDRLADVSESVWTGSMESAHVESVRECCTLGDAFVGVPTGTHRVNELFYNPVILENAGVDPDAMTGVQDLLSACERVEAETTARAVAHGTVAAWTTAQLLETVLLAGAGPAGLRRWIDGGDVDDQLTHAVTDVRSLLSFTETTDDGENAGTNEETNNVDHLDAARAVASGEAAFLQQGSWIAGELSEADGTFGEAWDRLAFPGTDGNFLLQLMGYAVPAATPRKTAARRWLSVLGSETGQRAVTEPAWTVPTRTDLEVGSFSRYQRAIYRDFRNASARPRSVTHGLAVPDTERSVVVNAVEDHVLGGSDVDRAVAALRSAVTEAD